MVIVGLSGTFVVGVTLFGCEKDSVVMLVAELDGLADLDEVAELDGLTEFTTRPMITY